MKCPNGHEFNAPILSVVYVSTIPVGTGQVQPIYYSVPEYVPPPSFTSNAQNFNIRIVQQCPKCGIEIIAD